MKIANEPLFLHGCSRSDDSFTMENWLAVWLPLDEGTKQSIRLLCRAHKISCSAAMRDYYPDLFKKVVRP